jgi:cyclopropane fatty-acyl-phospholipid synthase-like methyltransferase
MNPNKAPWEKGDFTRIAASMRESGQALVSALGVKSGLKVLDLGCGDGKPCRQRNLARIRSAQALSRARPVAQRPNQPLLAVQ